MSGNKPNLSPSMDFMNFIRQLERHSEYSFPPEGCQLDSGETVFISALALLKMVKHARFGVPLEVMGLLLGTFTDNYTIEIKDVFAMPQSGSATAVETTNEEFQTQMFELLRRVGMDDKVVSVGWYHSHPGYGCWLSSVDRMTHDIFQALNSRCVALVLDPVQSVKGKVVLDVFRLIDSFFGAASIEFKNVTGNIGCAESNSVDTSKQIARGLDRLYYKLNYKFRMSEQDKEMLEKTQSTAILDPLRLPSIATYNAKNLEEMKSVLSFTKEYSKLEEENLDDGNKNGTKKFGTEDGLKHLETLSNSLLRRNVLQNIRFASNIATFQACGLHTTDSDYEL